MTHNRKLLTQTICLGAALISLSGCELAQLIQEQIELDSGPQKCSAGLQKGEVQEIVAANAHRYEQHIAELESHIQSMGLKTELLMLPHQSQQPQQPQMPQQFQPQPYPYAAPAGLQPHAIYPQTPRPNPYQNHTMQRPQQAAPQGQYGQRQPYYNPAPVPHSLAGPQKPATPYIPAQQAGQPQQQLIPHQMRPQTPVQQPRPQPQQIAPAPYPAGSYNTLPTYPSANQPLPAASNPAHSYQQQQPQAAAINGQVFGFRTGVHKNKVRLAFDLTGFANYTKHIDPASRTLSIDMPGFNWATSPSSQLPRNPVISGYQTSQLPNGGTRLSMQLRKGAYFGKEGRIKPNRDSRNYRMFIDVHGN